MMPACGRCAKRNKPDQCVYHPAPLTKNAHASAEAASPRVNSFSIASQSPSSRDSTNESLQHGAKRMKVKSLCEPQLSFAGLPHQPERHSHTAFDALQKPINGSFNVGDGAGFISSSSILAEHELSIGIQPPHEDHLGLSSVSQSQIDRGAVVLTLFQDLADIKKYIKK